MARGMHPPSVPIYGLLAARITQHLQTTVLGPVVPSSCMEDFVWQACWNELARIEARRSLPESITDPAAQYDTSDLPDEDGIDGVHLKGGPV